MENMGWFCCKFDFAKSGHCAYLPFVQSAARVSSRPGQKLHIEALRSTIQREQAFS